MDQRRLTWQVRERLTWLAWLLDSSIPIPGTRLTIGLDALIGLVPVLGDEVGVLLSSYIVREAAALGAPRSILARMAFNVALEGLIGLIPLAGDVFDVAWEGLSGWPPLAGEVSDAAGKPTQRNVRLLGAWLAAPRAAQRSSRAF